MNYVGKVSNLVKQGVYSVATPFHPFGGAVDIIVVQQQDGSYRSTPWYVRFGKFQGVLKGAEKCVRINVNGIEADFHMCLDSAGEAYFSREIVLDQEGEGNGAVVKIGGDTSEDGMIYDDKSDDLSKGSYDRLQSTLSDPGVSCDAYSLMRPSRLERSESDAVTFYDFQDDQSSLDGSVDLSSEYNSSRYENEDGSSNYIEPQDSSAEMVLVSVDGHILTAPISSSEQDGENVRLDTPQFHLGPGQSAEFCEGSASFSVTDREWDTGRVTNMEVSSSSITKTVNSQGFSLKFESVTAQCVDNNSSLEEEQPNVRGREAAGGSHQDNTAELEKDERCEEHQDNTAKLKVSGEVDRCEQHQDDTGKLEVSGEDEKREEHQDNRAELEVSGEDEKCEQHQEQQYDDMNSPGVADRDEKNLQQSPVTDDGVTDTDDGHSNIDEASVSSKEEDRFSSCLKLSDFASHPSNGNIPGESSTSKIHQDEEVAQQDLSVSYQRFSHGFETPQKNDSFKTSTVDENERKVAGEIVKGLASSPHSTTSISSVTVVADKEFRSENNSSFDVQTFYSGQSSPLNNANLKDKYVISSCSKDQLETESSRKEENVEPQSTGVQADLGSGFDISLCKDLLHRGMGLNAAAEAFDQHRISQEEFKDSYASIIKNENLVVRIGECYFTWEAAAPIVLGKIVFGIDLPVEQTDVISVEQYESNKSEENDTLNSSTPRYWLWRNPFRRSRTLQPSTSTLSNEDVFLDSESTSHSTPTKSTPTSQASSPLPVGSKSPRKKVLRTNIPTSKQIASLNLKDGQNMVTFSFNTRVWGEQKVDAHIYLWKWNARIVISDVDGTITKSDVLGQFMPLVGRDWSQSGVARLFCAIKENGYQLLFLSARAIVQAYLTKSFLFNLKQDGKTLPNGPVVISPDGLFPSLYREVIRRAPHEFKIACLEDIKALFPPDYNPFYAGFGNRDTDELSYRKIGIPKGKIFIINPKGEVAISHRIDVKSYTSLHTLVNDMFPPTSMVEQEDYNAWNYWKMPLPDVED